MKFVFVLNIFLSFFKNTLGALTWDEQNALLDITVRFPILKKFPIRISYAIRFIRHIIDTLEANCVDVHDDFYTILCKYQTIETENNSNGFSYKHYMICLRDQQNIISLKENHNKISQGTTGLNVWEAAIVLCEWSIFNETVIAGKHIIELGAGTGLSGLVIAKCCQPLSVTFTDGNDKVLEYLNENIEINFIQNDNGIMGNNNTIIGKLMRRIFKFFLLNLKKNC